SSARCLPKRSMQWTRGERGDCDCGMANPLLGPDPECVAGRSAVSRFDSVLGALGHYRTVRLTWDLVGDRKPGAGWGVRARRLRPILLRGDAGQSAHHRVGFVVPRWIDPRRWLELSPGQAAQSDSRSAG